MQGINLFNNETIDVKINGKYDSFGSALNQKKCFVNPGIFLAEQKAYMI